MKLRCFLEEPKPYQRDSYAKPHTVTAEHLIRSEDVFLPRIQGAHAFFSSDPEQSVEHASVADLHALRLALDLEPGFGQINREGTWNILVKDLHEPRPDQ